MDVLEYVHICKMYMYIVYTFLEFCRYDTYMICIYSRKYVFFHGYICIDYLHAHNRHEGHKLRDVQRYEHCSFCFLTN